CGLALLLAGAVRRELAAGHVLLHGQRAVLERQRHHDRDVALLRGLVPLQRGFAALHRDVVDRDRTAAAATELGRQLAAVLLDGQRTLLRTTTVFNGQHPPTEKCLG